MLRDPAAKRYARAAFELALDRDELDVWLRDLDQLGTALASQEALDFVASYKVPPEEKLGFLERVVEQPALLVWNLVRLLASKARLALLPQIAEQFRELVDEHRGIAHAHVRTAVAMADDERAALTRRLSELTGKDVQVETEEAPLILGGVVARIGDRLIDGSTRSKLIALRRRLAAGA